MPSPTARDRAISTGTLVRGAVALVAVYFLALGATKLAHLWILIFGSVVVAVILRSIADPLIKRLKVPNGVGVGLAVLIVLMIVGSIAFLFGRQISRQVADLATTLPAAWGVLQGRLQASPMAEPLIGMLQSVASQSGAALALAPRIAMTAASGVTTLLLVVVAGVFLSIKPKYSREGVLSLVPLKHRDRLREVMDACGAALHGWLLAQLLSMCLVGTLVGVGLWIIGVPAPLALGLFTGLAQFVPIVGPIVSAVPALILSGMDGLQSFWLTLGLYVIVSQLEANLITPLVQKNLASLPVVLGIFAVVGLGILMGPLGVLFATPLALAGYTAVTMLYRQDVLGDPDAKAPGQHDD